MGDAALQYSEADQQHNAPRKQSKRQRVAPPVSYGAREAENRGSRADTPFRPEAGAVPTGPSRNAPKKLGGW
jgi:hypothetical protein